MLGNGGDWSGAGVCGGLLVAGEAEEVTSILIIWIFFFWQAKTQPPPQAAPIQTKRCATLSLRNGPFSNAWQVCDEAELQKVVRQINPDFLNGKSNQTMKKQ